MSMLAGLPPAARRAEMRCWSMVEEVISQVTSVEILKRNFFYESSSLRTSATSSVVSKGSTVHRSSPQLKNQSSQHVVLTGSGCTQKI